MDIKFDEIFSDEDITDYKLFIGKLKQLKEKGCSTKEILFLIYHYFEKYVKYNYDQLQIVKMLRLEKNEPSYECAEIYKRINDRINIINQISAQTQLSLNEIIECNLVDDPPYSKDDAIILINGAFLKVEGRNLTDKNIEIIFSDYGNSITIPHKKANRIGKFKTDEVLEHEEIQGMNVVNYKPLYYNDMLRDGVSSDYKKFLKKIFKDLKIKHIEIEGIETTEHSWNMIYLPEEERWVHFDMAMVKFYQDEWIKDHEPYNMEDWVTASTSDIFKMQPTRKITKINGVKCLFNKDNYNNLDMKKYDYETIR